MSNQSEAQRGRLKRRASQSLEGSQRKKAKLDDHSSGDQDGQSHASEQQTSAEREEGATNTPSASQHPPASLATDCATQLLNLLMVMASALDRTRELRHELGEHLYHDWQVEGCEGELALLEDQNWERTYRLTQLATRKDLDIHDESSDYLTSLPIEWFDSVHSLVGTRSLIAELDEEIRDLRAKLKSSTQEWEAAHVVERVESPGFYITNSAKAVDAGSKYASVHTDIHTLSSAQTRMKLFRKGEVREVERLMDEARTSLTAYGFRCTDAERAAARAIVERKMESAPDDPADGPAAEQTQQAQQQVSLEGPTFMEAKRQQARRDLDVACRDLRYAYQDFDDVRKGYYYRRHRFFTNDSRDATRTEYDLLYFVSRGEANNKVVKAEADLLRLKRTAQGLGALSEAQTTSNFRDNTDEGHSDIEAIAHHIDDSTDWTGIRKWLAENPAPDGFCDPNQDAVPVEGDMASLEGSVLEDEDRCHSDSLKRKIEAYKKQQAKWRREEEKRRALEVAGAE